MCHRIVSKDYNLTVFCSAWMVQWSMVLVWKHIWQQYLYVYGYFRSFWRQDILIQPWWFSIYTSCFILISAALNIGCVLLMLQIHGSLSQINTHKYESKYITLNERSTKWSGKSSEVGLLLPDVRKKWNYRMVSVYNPFYTLTFVCSGEVDRFWVLCTNHSGSWQEEHYGGHAVLDGSWSRH